MKKVGLFGLVVLHTFFVSSQNEYIVKTKERNDVSKNIQLTDEEKWERENFPFIALPDWQNGIQFMAIKKNYSNEKDNEYVLLQVDSVKELFVERLLRRGHEAVVFFSKKEDNSFFCKYEVGKSFDEIRSREGMIESLLTTVNSQEGYDFIYLGDIQKARDLLLNKKVYILTDEWCSDAKANEGFKTYNKFVPITITQIGMSEEVNFPVKIIFKDNKDEEYYIMVSLSGTNQTIMPIETWGCWSKFSKVFSFKNPKLKYPKISASTWNLITQGKVRIGMSKESCKLSWGEPESINKTTGSYGVHEQWVYGYRYLYFENGKLNSIQN